MCSRQGADSLHKPQKGLIGGYGKQGSGQRLPLAAYISSPSLSSMHRDIVTDQQASPQIIAKLWKVVLGIAIHHVEWNIESL